MFIISNSPFLAEVMSICFPPASLVFEHIDEILFYRFLARPLSIATSWILENTDSAGFLHCIESDLVSGAAVSKQVVDANVDVAVLCKDEDAGGDFDLARDTGEEAGGRDLHVSSRNTLASYGIPEVGGFACLWHSHPPVFC